MNTSIGLLPSCPNCHVNLTADPDSSVTLDKDICWNCGRKLKNPHNKHFECPDYLYHQKNSLIEELGMSKLKPGDLEYDKALEEIQKNLVLWTRECTTEDRLAPLFDSIYMLENLIYTITTPEDIKSVISLAKNIGTLGNALEQYFKAGGSYYDRKVRRVRPDTGDTSWDQATATARRDS